VVKNMRCHEINERELLQDVNLFLFFFFDGAISFLFYGYGT